MKFNLAQLAKTRRDVDRVAIREIGLGEGKRGRRWKRGKRGREGEGGRKEKGEERESREMKGAG